MSNLSERSAKKPVSIRTVGMIITEKKDIIIITTSTTTIKCPETSPRVEGFTYCDGGGEGVWLEKTGKVEGIAKIYESIRCRLPHIT